MRKRTEVVWHQNGKRLSSDEQHQLWLLALEQLRDLGQEWSATRLTAATGILKCCLFGVGTLASNLSARHQQEVITFFEDFCRTHQLVGPPGPEALPFTMRAKGTYDAPDAKQEPKGEAP